MVADCQETKEGDATFRTLTLKDGGKIKEKLLESDDTSYSYEIIESPLPVKNYKAKLSVEADERGADRYDDRLGSDLRRQRQERRGRREDDRRHFLRRP